MAKYDDLWTILNEYKLETYLPLSNELVCTICRRILVEAYNSPCGCRYCHQCIKSFLESGNEQHCPGQLDDCHDQVLDLHENVHIDNVANKKISLLIVKCPELECEFKDELRNIKSHIESHKYDCPYANIGCNSYVTGKGFISDHMENEHYSHSLFLIDYFHNMKNEITTLKEDLETNNRNLTKINEIIHESDRMSMENGIQNDEIKELDNSLKKYHDENQKFISEMQKMSRQIQANNADLRILKSHFDKNKEYRCSLDRDLKDTKAKENEFNDNIKRTEKKQKDLEKLILESHILPFPSMHVMPLDAFQWRIGRFMKKLNDIQSGTLSEIVSEPFYTHKNGYKMCLKLFPEKFKTCNKTHLPVFFYIMKGQFDDMLPWPMKLRIHICLMDQLNGEVSMAQRYQYDHSDLMNTHVYDKPITSMNRGLGASTFIALNRLIENPGTFHNDTIFLKCFVDQI